MGIKQAWLALRGELEPQAVEKLVERIEERLVPFGDGVRDVYVVSSKSYKLAQERHGAQLQSWGYANILTKPLSDRPEPPTKPDWVGRVYLTCAQAFAEHGDDADVQQAKAIIANGKAYLFGSLTERELAPKPKVAKGRGK